MTCPVCKLINPPGSRVCDCGHDFITRVGGHRVPNVRLRALWASIWFTWAVVTAGDFLTLRGAGNDGRWNSLPNAIFNLFTPILYGNLAKPHLMGLVVPILFLGLIVGDWLGHRIRITTLRIVFNLAFLLSLTAAIDTIVWGSPKSFERIRSDMHP